MRGWRHTQTVRTTKTQQTHAQRTYLQLYNRQGTTGKAVNRKAVKRGGRSTSGFLETAREMKHQGVVVNYDRNHGHQEFCPRVP